MNTVQMHSILRRLFGYAKHKARTVASSGKLGRLRPALFAQVADFSGVISENGLKTLR